MFWKRLKCLLCPLFILAILGIFACGLPVLAVEPGIPLEDAAIQPGLPERNPLHIENVQLSAVLGPGQPALGSGLSWNIYALNDEEAVEPEAEPLWTGSDASPKLKLKPGHYLAEVSYGLASNEQKFEVRFAEPATPVIPLNAASMKIHAVAAVGGKRLENMFFVLRAHGEGGTDELVRSSLPEAVFHVPAGNYVLSANHGLASVEQQVSVQAGEVRNIEIQMDMGEVTLSAHAADDGQPLTGATFFVYGTSEAGQNKEIIRSRLLEPTFSLPAGRYRIAATLGLARTESNLTIDAGKSSHQRLILNGASLKLTSSLAGNDIALDRNVLYRIYGLSSESDSANQGEILRSTIAKPTLFLPSGRYRVESQYGWHNARQTREIEIKPGNETAIDFVHKASNIRLRLVNRKGGTPLNPVKWTLKYNGSGTAVISQDAEPELILQDGSYQAIAQHGSKTYTQIFDAKSNNDQIIELIVQ